MEKTEEDYSRMYKKINLEKFLELENLKEPNYSHFTFTGKFTCQAVHGQRLPSSFSGWYFKLF